MYLVMGSRAVLRPASLALYSVKPCMYAAIRKVTL